MLGIARTMSPRKRPHPFEWGLRVTTSSRARLLLLRAAAGVAGEEPIRTNLGQCLSVGVVGLVANQGHDHRLGPREAGAQFLEVLTRDNAILVPLQEEDLGGDLGEDRS